MIYELYKRYTEPHRKYHNLRHIFRMFEIAQNRGMELNKAQVLAIWFHVSIYDVPAGEVSNEKRSASLAESALIFDAKPPSMISRVRHMVLATEAVLKPEVPDLTDEEWQVCGLDLYDLGTSRYWPNRDDIRSEFGHLSAAEWIDGRSAFLKMMAAKELIIGLPFFGSQSEFENWHVDARSNINQELDFLKLEVQRGSQ
jgi:predicted metal-dependent HD superfamily phosphohydrolase